MTVAHDEPNGLMPVVDFLDRWDGLPRRILNPPAPFIYLDRMIARDDTEGEIHASPACNLPGAIDYSLKTTKRQDLPTDEVFIWPVFVPRLPRLSRDPVALSKSFTRMRRVRP